MSAASSWPQLASPGGVALKTVKSKAVNVAATVGPISSSRALQSVFCLPYGGECGAFRPMGRGLRPGLRPLPKSLIVASGEGQHHGGDIGRQILPARKKKQSSNAGWGETFSPPAFFSVLLFAVVFPRGGGSNCLWWKSQCRATQSI